MSRFVQMFCQQPKGPLSRELYGRRQIGTESLAGPPPHADVEDTVERHGEGRWEGAQGHFWQTSPMIGQLS
jgi:hypothetical protein